MNDAVGTVESLWRFPVKSMLGETPDEVAVSQRGVVGDRAFGLLDRATGKLASAKHPRLWGQLLSWRARYVEPPLDDAALPVVQITLPDGSVVHSDDPDIDEVLSAAIGRAVRLTSDPPQRPVIESAAAGREIDVGIGWFAPGTFQDGAPLHLLTTSTLRTLEAAQPEASFDPRRFRPNAVIATAPGQEGFVENEWLGLVATIGADVRVPIILAVPRCVMTVLGQEDLPRDNTVLQTIAKNNRLDVPSLGPGACAGVYGTVATAGVIRRGDTVRITDNAEVPGIALERVEQQGREGFIVMAQDAQRIHEQLQQRR